LHDKLANNREIAYKILENPNKIYKVIEFPFQFDFLTDITEEDFEFLLN